MDTWKKNGYMLLSNVLDDTILNDSIKYLKKIYNTKKTASNDFGSDGKLEFPTNKIIDFITLNENLIEIVENLLNDEILLVQSDTWSKYGTQDFSSFSNNNQRMHMDYGNNMFLHPADWNNPEAVAAIVYFSDTSITGGGTALVPRNEKTLDLYKPPYVNMPGIANYLFYNDKNHAEIEMQKAGLDIIKFREKLYNNEIILKPNIGDVLFYRLDLWHRGTPVNIDKHRIVMNLLWKKKSCHWINQWNPGWTRSMYYTWLENIFVDLTPKQRAVLGIPLPGNKYWNKTTIKYLKSRYPKINCDPYLSKL